jgi:hypothetical protein
MPKPRNFESDDDELCPPRAKQRTNTGAKATKDEKRQLLEERKKAMEVKRAEMMEKKLEREREKKQKALEREEMCLQKKEERLKKEKQKAETKAMRERERELKRVAADKVKEQKRLAKQLKAQSKVKVERPNFTQYLKDRGLTSTSTPEALTELLEHARKYHSQLNGNAVTYEKSKSDPKLSAGELAALKEKYTSPESSLAGVSSVTPCPLIPPTSVHSIPPELASPPLQHEDAIVRAQEGLVVASVMFDNSELDELSVEEETSNEIGEEETGDDVDLEDIVGEEPIDSVDDASSAGGSLIEIPSLAEMDDESESLRREQAELERLLALMEERSKLRKQNDKLREEIEKLKKQ